MEEFIGRDKELLLLENQYKSKRSSITVIYGRRRIGKSALIKRFTQGKEALLTEGLEGEKTPEQITHFIYQLSQQISDPLLTETAFKSWNAVFTYITKELDNKKKIVLVFDELQWMAAKRSRLISIIKFFWDNHWKDKNVHLILCGSIASFMINKVLNSKALYGRVSSQLHLKAFKPQEIFSFLQAKRWQKRDIGEILLYSLIFGGIPRYLEEIDTKKSLQKNIEQLCFTDSGFFVKEFERIFYGQFKEAKSYLKIIHSLTQKPLSLAEIAKETKIPSGGGLRSLIQNLIEADFIGLKRQFGTEQSSKLKKYYIIDEYLRFYFKYIKPHLNLIVDIQAPDIFKQKIVPHWNQWLGLAFENFCLKNGYLLAQQMNFEQETIEIASFSPTKKTPAQFDILFKRADKTIVIGEIKYNNEPISTKIIPELEAKIKHLPIPRGYSVETALISKSGASKPLHESQYFNYEVQIEELFLDHSTHNKWR